MSVADPYLELSSDPIRFEAVSQLTNVFFDNSNKQVFAVRSGGAIGVVVKGPEPNKSINFRMEDHGPVISIKFSPDEKILAIQRTYKSVEFMNFNGTQVEQEYSQSCKKNATILGFVWSQSNEVALVTDHGIELYLVIADKKSFRHLKSLAVTTQWFVWCPQNKLALLASGQGSHLQPVHFKPGSISKLAKVERLEQGRITLERDVTLATLYGSPAILILRHSSDPLKHSGVEVHLLAGPGMAPIRTHSLLLGLSGRFAINVVDDLILVHHQASRTSLVFDISLPTRKDNVFTYHGPAAPPRSLRPTSLSLPGLVEPQSLACELYSPNWVVFQPNIIIDAKLGCLWHIRLNLQQLCSQITDLSVCVQLALKRTEGKSIVLKVLRDAISLPAAPLTVIRQCFDHVNAIYRSWAEAQIENQAASAISAVTPKPPTAPRVVIDQNDVYEEILQRLDTDTQLAQIEKMLVIYLTSLGDHGISTQHHLSEMLLTTLVRRRKFAALQQYLQYGVVSDSKPLACLLLSLGNLHSAASQLALDMLARLDAKEEIQEVLLSDGQILSALKLAGDGASPRKFLQIARNDEELFHSVLYHLKANPRFQTAFHKDERLKKFAVQYRETFALAESA